MSNEDATTKPTLDTVLERINKIGEDLRGDIRQLRGELSEFRIETGKRLDLLDRKLDILAKQVLEVQARQSLLEDRVERLEVKPS